MRLQYANRSAKLQNNTRTIKIHTEMPLAHICTRGIPIIYYQRKMLLTPYRFAYNFFTLTFSSPFFLPSASLT